MPMIPVASDPTMLRGGLGVEPVVTPPPTLGETFRAGFGQDNTIVNLARSAWQDTYPPVEGYSPIDDIRNTPYFTNHGSLFAASQSQSETRSIMRRIDVEDGERRTLAASGTAGFVAQVAAGLIDPTIALPGGIIVRSTKLGYEVSRSALSVGMAATGQVAGQEAILQGAQETRTAGESAIAIGSGAILGGLIGGGAAALLTRTERVALEKLIDADRAAIDAHATGQPVSAGAAASDTRQLEMDLVGRFGAQLSPTRRTLAAEAVEARRVMADLAETPYRFKENEAGVASTQGPAVDRLARMEMNGQRAVVGDELDRAFADYRFGAPDTTLPRLRARVQSLTGGGEGKMSYHDFKKEVSVAMQNGDMHAIPQVAQAAQFIRKRLDTWAERAEQSVEGFERLTPADGEAYFPHVWNKQKIKAQRPEFVDRLTDLYVTDQTTKRGIQEQLGPLAEELKALEAKIAKAGTPEAAAEATLARDAARGKIEGLIAAWEGKSVSEAKSAIKAREKYAADTARAADAPRLESADTAIDKTVEGILKSDRDRPMQEIRSRANETVNRLLGSPDGRLPYDEHFGGPRIGPQTTVPPRGSLAGRALHVSNAWARDWIEDDIEQVVAMHLRTVVPDVLLAERFGDVEMTQAFRRINESYDALIDATKGEKERTRLGKEREHVIRDVAAVRDRVRGVYGWSQDLQNMARVANAAKAVNNMTSMGVAAVSSLPDLAGAIFRFGLTSTFRDGWVPFFRNLTGQSEEWGKFKGQMRSLGIGVETAINARQHALDDVVDVYRPQSRVERALQGASDKFFIANLLAPLTDAEKLIASHVAVSEILRATKAAAEGKATKRQIANLAESGIDRQMAGRIWAQFQAGGEVTNGVHLPNAADWRDRSAADALNGAVAREVDIAVVTPGQEKPLWMSKPVVSLLGQFKSFTASATERILIANLQRRDAAALQGLVFSIGLGMMTYKLNSFFGGQKTSDRPQDWVKEGISRGGILGWLEDGNALASKASRGSVDIYRAIGADKPLSRFASRSAADMLLGPTWGKIESLPKITGSLAGGDWSAADTTAVRRLMPFQNLVWLRGLLNQVEAGTNSALGIPERKEPVRH